MHKGFLEEWLILDLGQGNKDEPGVFCSVRKVESAQSKTKQNRRKQRWGHVKVH